VPKKAGDDFDLGHEFTFSRLRNRRTLRGFGAELSPNAGTVGAAGQIRSKLRRLIAAISFPKRIAAFELCASIRREGIGEGFHSLRRTPVYGRQVATLPGLGFMAN
jgi:hypothetical protein